MIACHHPVGIPADYLVDVPSVLDVDSIIEQLVSQRGKNPVPHVDLPESDIKGNFHHFIQIYYLFFNEYK